ncbi:MAG TPA: glycosyltransferase family 2 protein [Chitinophagaceae bacterium]|nr:glycosyltransferase family 2 protein [Chitinophagaceae bacterium]
MITDLPKNRILLSIIIPTFNAAHNLRELLPVIARQTFQQYEILILDNFSTDGTPGIIKERQAGDTRIRYISEQDKGIYHAMNNGIELAKGDWVYFMGSDDSFYDTNVLSVVASNFDKEYDIVYGNVMWVPDHIIEQGEWGYKELLGRNINHQRIFYKRSLFQQYGAYDLRYKIAADHALNIRLFCNPEVKKKYIPSIVAAYHSGGFSAEKTDEVFWDNWTEAVYRPFSGVLPSREIYASLNSYYRYNLQKKKYRKAFTIFWKIFSHTRRPGFIWLALKQFFQSFKRHGR